MDDYNNQYHRKIDGQHKLFPFHLDQMIINGRRFFEMSAHYQQQVINIVDEEHGKLETLLDHHLSDYARKILQTINNYKNRTRSGDKYVRAIFDCALIFYIDKFGTTQLSQAIEKLFVWAYSLRIKQQVVQLATMDNYVVNNNVFRTIKDAIIPSDVLTMSINTLSDIENKNNARKNNAHDDPLVMQFKEMNYYE